MKHILIMYALNAQQLELEELSSSGLHIGILGTYLHLK